MRFLAGMALSPQLALWLRWQGHDETVAQLRIQRSARSFASGTSP
jgi:hypothetical protein